MLKNFECLTGPACHSLRAHLQPLTTSQIRPQSSQIFVWINLPSSHARGGSSPLSLFQILTMGMTSGISIVCGGRQGKLICVNMQRHFANLPIPASALIADESESAD